MQTLPPLYPQNPLLSPQLQTLQFLSQLNPYQQALFLPLLSQNNPLSSPMFIPSKDEEIVPGLNKESIFSLKHLQQSPLSFYQMSDSTQDNSPKLAYYNLGFGMNEGFSLQDKPIYAATSLLSNNLPNLSLLAHGSKKIKKQKNQNNLKKLGTDNILTNIRKESCDSIIQSSGFKSPSLSAMKQNSNSVNSMFNGPDDKNIIHINFTKNLLKSFRRYCEYYHKNNQQLLQQIKTDFETNHMNNQLLVHFMTGPVTTEYFQLFVDGPAQKWVKEQSRLKKQDQQLELIEICRQRLFDKIKVKKYCDTVQNTIQADDNQGSQSPNMTPIVTPSIQPQPIKKQSSLTAQPIFNQTSFPQAQVKSALSSSSSSSDISDDEDMADQKNNQLNKNPKDQCEIEDDDDDDSSKSGEINQVENISIKNIENNDLKVNFEAKIEEIEQTIKIEDEY